MKNFAFNKLNILLNIHEIILFVDKIEKNHIISNINNENNLKGKK